MSAAIDAMDVITDTLRIVCAERDALKSERDALRAALEKISIPDEHSDTLEETTLREIAREALK